MGSARCTNPWQYEATKCTTRTNRKCLSYRCDKHLDANLGCDLCVPEEERRKHFECESCKEGYFLNLKLKQCQKCNLCDGLGEYVEVSCKVDQDSICDVYTCDYSNCKDCVSLRDRVKHGECSTCYDGFYLDKKNSKCVECSDTCDKPWQYESQKCETESNRECQSYECLKGTRHNPHCAVCVEEKHRREHYECAQCYSGYFVDIETKQCKSCNSCETEDCGGDQCGFGKTSEEIEFEVGMEIEESNQSTSTKLLLGQCMCPDGITKGMLVAPEADTEDGIADGCSGCPSAVEDNTCICMDSWSDPTCENPIEEIEGCPKNRCDNIKSERSWCIVKNPGCDQEEQTDGGQWAYCGALPDAPITCDLCMGSTTHYCHEAEGCLPFGKEGDRCRITTPPGFQYKCLYGLKCISEHKDMMGLYGICRGYIADEAIGGEDRDEAVGSVLHDNLKQMKTYFGHTHRSMTFVFIMWGIMMSILICAHLINKSLQDHWQKNERVNEFTSLLIENETRR